MLNKIVKRFLFSISIFIFTVGSISLYMKIDDTFTFVIIESFFLFIVASMLFVTNKISNHIDSMQEVNKVNNILVKHYPNEATVYYSNRATTDMDSNLFKNNKNQFGFNNRILFKNNKNQFDFNNRIHGGISISNQLTNKMLPSRSHQLD